MLFSVRGLRRRLPPLTTSLSHDSPLRRRHPRKPSTRPGRPLLLADNHLGHAGQQRRAVTSKPPRSQGPLKVPLVTTTRGRYPS